MSRIMDAVVAIIIMTIAINVGAGLVRPYMFVILSVATISFVLLKAHARSRRW